MNSSPLFSNSVVFFFFFLAFLNRLQQICWIYPFNNYFKEFLFFIFISRNFYFFKFLFQGIFLCPFVLFHNALVFNFFNFYGVCSFISLGFPKFLYLKLFSDYYFNLLLSKSVFQLVIWLADFFDTIFCSVFAVLVFRLILKERFISPTSLWLYLSLYSDFVIESNQVPRNPLPPAM